MTRYIDVDSIEMPLFESKIDETWVRVAIDATPTADVQPVRHGKWIPVRSYEAFGGDETMWAVRGNPIAFYYCSNCRNDAYAGEDGESLLTKYCPNCGAKMEDR